MNPKYRFFLQINDGEKIPVNPIYSDDMTLDYEMESNQRFYRAKLSGNFEFVRQDFALIMAADFDSVYYLYIELTNDWGQTWAQYYKSMFMRTDCTIDEDNQLITVQPNAVDQYNDILAGLEKEYNIIPLAPEIEKIKITKRPLIQIYVPGESIISCFLSGLSWEQDANTIDNISDLGNVYHFAKIINIASITLAVGTPENAGEQQILNDNPWINEAVGTYVGELSGNYKFINVDNGYYFQADNPGNTGRYSLYNERGEKLGQTPVFLYVDPTAGYFSFEMDYIIDYDEYGEPIYRQFDYLVQSAKRNIPIMGRYLLDVETILDLQTYELPIDDIVANNRNYRRAIGYAIDNTIIISTNFSDSPTEYGLANNGKYYLPPYSFYGQKYYPIARSQWGNYSIWFAFHVLDDIFEKEGRKQYQLRDNYSISSIISVLLKQIAPEISHEPTPEYSRFLYDDVNPLTGYAFRLFATPKSNILVGEYQTPTQKAPTTLQQILDMLRNTFQLYWHVEDNRLRIEHISWYRNGGTYFDGYAVIGYDLTKLMNLRNGKTWDFGLSKYSFDKEDLPERYQFQWMDEVTAPFKGEAMQVISKYVMPGKIEEINIGGFSSDVDLMLLNPEAFSQEGFALFAAVSGENGMEVPFVRFDSENVTYYLQNGFLAMVLLQPQYWLYDMPARRILVNNIEMWAYGIQRRKSQEITFPIGESEPDVKALIKTNIGNGEIQKLSINLSSRTAKATLKYDTE